MTQKMTEMEQAMYSLKVVEARQDCIASIITAAAMRTQMGKIGRRVARNRAKAEERRACKKLMHLEKGCIESIIDERTALDVRYRLHFDPVVVDYYDGEIKVPEIRLTLATGITTYHVDIPVEVLTKDPLKKREAYEKLVNKVFYTQD